MKTLKKYRWPLTGALLGALIFLLLYGVRVLDPTSVDWILNNPSPDPAQHYLGWELFRRSPVHLPYIGANYNAIYPFRTSVLFTDSLPLAALLFGLFRSLSNVYTGFDFLAQLNLPSTFYNMLPYIISLLVLALTSSKSRAPKAEGIPYDKGSR